MKIPSAAVLALVLAMGLVACDDQGDTALEEAEESASAASLGGTDVTVSGEVTSVIPPDALVISGDDASFGVEEGTLVYGIDAGEYAEVVDGTYVQVSGTVDEFLVADVESEFGLDYDDALLSPWEQELAVQASSLTAIPERGITGDDTALEELEEDGTAGEAVGTTVEVAGDVEEVLSPNAFRISGDEAGEGTLVFTAEAAEVRDGTIVEATGTVVEYVVVDIESTLGLDLDDDLFGDLEDEFAVIADTVETVPEQ